MRILVCVKQVPDLQGEIHPDRQALGYIAVRAALKMNLYDEFAVEEALRIKESRGNEPVEVVALSAGPACVKETVRRAIAMGADRGAWIEDPSAQQGDALALAAEIAAHVREAGYDLILTGVLSEDMQRGQLGPMVAALLGWPCATAVIHEELSPDGSRVLVQREREGGDREEVDLPLPALLTIQSGIHEVRYPTLTHTLRARRAEIERLAPPASAVAAEPAGATLDVSPRRRAGRVEFLQGDLEAMADALIARIHARTGLV